MTGQPNLTLVPSPDSPEALRHRRACERALPDIEQVPEEKLVHITIDVPDLVSAALGVLPRVLLFREQAAGLPHFDVSCFDELETHALALSQRT